MNQLLVICGPTATGKTELGIKLAREFKGEIVSADSRQVYRYMDIGTGKEISKFSIFNDQFSINNYSIGYHLINKIPVWLMDVCEPNKKFSAAHFVEHASRIINGIWERGKLPIVVGGTGFWIKALIDGVNSIGIPPDQQLRERLKNLEIKKLQEKLVGLNPGRWREMNPSDRNNPRRLVRAIEVANQFSIFNFQFSKIKKLKIDELLMIGLKIKDYQSLYERIDNRVEKRVKEGIEGEIKSLLNKGYSWTLSSFSATGYRVWKDYFKGKKSLKETIQRWQYDEHGLARRQLTYLKKDKRIKWFEIDGPAYQPQIEKLVGEWYSGD